MIEAGGQSKSDARTRKCCYGQRYFGWKPGYYGALDLVMVRIHSVCIMLSSCLLSCGRLSRHKMIQLLWFPQTQLGWSVVNTEHYHIFRSGFRGNFLTANLILTQIWWDPHSRVTSPLGHNTATNWFLHKSANSLLGISTDSNLDFYL